MNISEPFIRRPVATSLFTLAIALSGLAAFRLLPISPLPQVDFPTIQVSAGLPGASPETMASSVATPLERQFGHIAGIAEMTSTSYLGSTSIALQFDLSRNVDAAARDVQAAINAARGNLPANLPSNPTYRKVNPADAPVLILSLTSPIYNQAQMYDAASSLLQQKIAQIEGVGQVIVGGSSLPAVRVELNPYIVNQYKISMDSIRSTLSTANANIPKGEVANAHTAMTLYTTDQLLKADLYKPLIVAYRDGAPVRISDLGDVRDSVEDVRNAGVANGKPAVLLIIFRQPGANIIETVDRCYAVLPQLQASIPPGMHLEIMVDRTSTIRASIKDVEQTLVISILLVILVVFIFLRNPLATLIPSVVVPLSLIGTFGVMYLLDYSLDNLSLMALTISTGFVVDDAIVVIENIARYLESGMAPFEAALKGSSEIGFTVLSMSTSLVAVFIPILMMGGIVGRLFREFAVTLSIAIGMSMIVSLTATPMMCARFLKHDRKEKHGDLYKKSERFFDWMLQTYATTLQKVLRHPALTLTVFLLTVSVNIALFMIIPKGFFPQQDTGRLTGSIQAQQNISFQLMRQKLNDIVSIVMTDPAVANMVAFTGGSGGTNTGRMFIGLKDMDQRKISIDEVIARIRKNSVNIPGAQLFLQAVQDIRIGGRNSAAQYQFTLQSQDLTLLNDFAPKIMKKLRTLPQLVDLNTDQQNNGQQAQLVIDRDTASRLGLTTQNIDDALYDAFGQRQVSTMYTPLNQYHVIMEVAPEYWQNPQILRTLYAQTPTGQSVPFAAFTRFSPAATPLVVNHQGQFPSVTLSFNLPVGVALGDAVDAIHRAMLDLRVPSSIQGSFSGTAQAFQDSLANEWILILTALVAVYIVLGILYESYIHPITILSTLPSAGVGALLALLICRTDLSVIALIGIILLIGIVKKNAILMIDFALEAERKDGKSPQDAIYEACLLRFRPITMTTMAALLGALPLAFGTGTGSELRRPLGIAIVGGLIVSQMLTLFTTPVVYLYMERLRVWTEAQGARWKKMAGIAIGGLFLPGCFLAPHYKRPTVETPPAFKEASSAVMPQTATPVSSSSGTVTSAGGAQWKMANPSDTLAHGPWWQMFGDPQLNELEKKVLVSNQTIREAEAQYRAARSVVSQVRSNYFPTVTTQPSVTRSLAPNVSSRSNSANSNIGITNLFDLPVTAAWEPDFWGAVTFAVRTAKAEAQASAAQLESMRLSMQAELAADYFSLAAIDMQSALLNSATASYEKALKLTLARFNAGIASQTDVAQARTQLDSTHAQATDLGITRAQLEHAIAVLIGQAPATFSLSSLSIHRVPPTIPVGLPSQLLERRPDIASAERLIVAANGQIGLARAAYFPNISLTATGGYESNFLSNWLTWPQRFWSIGASAAETVLDFGRRRAVAQQAQAAYDAQVAVYRQTVLSAFQEVEDNLAALRLLAEETVEQDAATQGAEQSLALEMERYKSGIVSYLDIITTQNIALTNERASVQILGRRMNAAVTLIRAVGGGWDDSQLPWPKNLYSPPTASSAPITSVAAANPPAPDITVSTATPAAVDISSNTTVKSYVLPVVSTSPFPAVLFSTPTISPSTSPVYTH